MYKSIPIGMQWSVVSMVNSNSTIASISSTFCGSTSLLTALAHIIRQLNYSHFKDISFHFSCTTIVYIIVLKL